MLDNKWEVMVLQVELNFWQKKIESGEYIEDPARLRTSVTESAESSSVSFNNEYSKRWESKEKESSFGDQRNHSKYAKESASGLQC